MGVMLSHYYYHVNKKRAHNGVVTFSVAMSCTFQVVPGGFNIIILRVKEQNQGMIKIHYSNSRDWMARWISVIVCCSSSFQF